MDVHCCIIRMCIGVRITQVRMCIGACDMQVRMDADAKLTLSRPLFDVQRVPIAGNE